ncbi:MAG: hypothetical protein SLAVMIC_00772 [uncultured marine phage]|uniref:Uncharacterized protein n=1 Tax=uncultured marine phage TaxID=707152 RepID=A0A8D9CDL8_9VIRU|nr:MAG: hypothetical protein SLAVMIC_00772 [uncultured marine phage]
MKNLKKFESFVNEELSPETYQRAAQELKDKGQDDTAKRMIDHSKELSQKAHVANVMSKREGKPQYDIPVEFNITFGFNESEGAEVVFVEGKNMDGSGEPYITMLDQEVWNKAKGGYKRVNLNGVTGTYDHGELVDPDDANFVMFWEVKSSPELTYKGDELRDFMVAVHARGGKLKLDHFNGKCASRRDALQLAKFFELLYANDIQKGEGYSFSTFIDDNFGGFSSFRDIMDIRTFY